MITKDKFGPAYVVRVYDSRLGMEGFLVIDNLVLGPGKGGIRMTANVSEEEVWRLARTMTWKNSLAGIPFGGAKAGIVWKGGDSELKKQFVQSFARLIKMFTPKYYIAGPDVNTGEEEMRWFVEVIGNWKSATGKPADFCVKNKCGIPHEFGSTGFGIAHSSAIAASIKSINISGATIAIDGFGNVGSFAFKHLTKMGAKIVAIADINGTIYQERGFDEAVLNDIKSRRASVMEYPDCKKLERGAVFTFPVDILIPASVTDVINDQNKNEIKAKIIIEAANIPMREDIEDELFKKGILIVPDFVANAGGVISSYAEYRGYNPEKMFNLVENKIKKSVKTVLERSFKEKKNPRLIALEAAQTIIETKTSKLK